MFIFLKQLTDSGTDAASAQSGLASLAGFWVSLISRIGASPKEDARGKFG
jgi:hypothetical protein